MDTGRTPASAGQPLPGVSRPPALGSGLSSRADAASAAAEAADRAREALGVGDCDLAMVFVGGAHVRSAGAVAAECARRLSPGVQVGISTQAVIGGAAELEGEAGVSVLAARLPGVRLVAYRTDDLVGPASEGQAGASGGSGADRIARTIGAAPDLRATILLVDPFSVPLVKLLPEINAARSVVDGRPAGLVLGGLASGGKAAGQHRVILGDRAMESGGVGVSIAGPVRIDAVVSQGARPLGENMVVTRSKGNAVLELGGRPALSVLEGLFEHLDEADQTLVREQGVLLGIVTDEYKDRFGRADYLVRLVVGGDRESGAIAVADRVRVGQTVRFHVRDRGTAHDDLEMLLDAQAIHGPPAGVLLITCNDRGRALFGASGHDATAVCRAFAPELPGEERAKGGFRVGTGPTIPLAGFFASGEIGPSGDRGMLHGQTACVVLFRGM